MATDKPRFSVTFSNESFDRIQKYQNENGISTQSKAVARLVEIALNEMESTQNAFFVPETTDAEELSHIQKYRNLDKKGKKAVDTVLEVESQRSKELKEAKDAQEKLEQEINQLREDADYARWMSTPFAARDGGLQSANEMRVRHLKVLDKDILKKKKKSGGTD